MLKFGWYMLIVIVLLFVSLYVSNLHTKISEKDAKKHILIKQAKVAIRVVFPSYIIIAGIATLYGLVFMQPTGELYNVKVVEVLEGNIEIQDLIQSDEHVGNEIHIVASDGYRSVITTPTTNIRIECELEDASMCEIVNATSQRKCTLFYTEYIDTYYVIK